MIEYFFWRVWFELKKCLKTSASVKTYLVRHSVLHQFLWDEVVPSIVTISTVAKYTQQNEIISISSRILRNYGTQTNQIPSKRFNFEHSHQYSFCFNLSNAFVNIGCHFLQRSIPHRICVYILYIFDMYLVYREFSYKLFENIRSLFALRADWNIHRDK